MTYGSLTFEGASIIWNEADSANALQPCDWPEFRPLNNQLAGSPMRLLQTGITGFHSTTEVPAARLKRAVYAAAQAAGAKVGEFRPADGVTPNFHRVDVDFSSRTLVVLCNRHVPVLAFAGQVDGMEIERFLEAPVDFAATMTASGFDIGDVAELNRRVTSGDLEMLSTTEQDQAKYWKPERVGDIIFNWWD